MNTTALATDAPPSDTSSAERRPITRLARSAAFVFLAALIMVIGSERMFWYWTPEVLPQFEAAAFYGIGSATGLALMRRYNVTSIWSLMLVAPVVGMVVEGVITPVTYSGGPFVPFFPAWFSFWHGILAFSGLLFGLRHLLLHGTKRVTAAVSVGLGAFWGLFLTNQLLPENYNDEELLEHNSKGVLEVLDPGQFTLYAFAMTGLLMLGHALIGYVWPDRGRSSGHTGRLGGREALVVVYCLGFAALWTAAYFWALPMFLAYCWIQIKGLRWHREATDVEEVSLIDQLRGNVRLTSLAPLVLMAPTAALVYGVAWEMDLSLLTLRVIMYSIIVIQAVAGLGIGIAALVKARRRLRTSSPESASSSTSSSALSLS